MPAKSKSQQRLMGMVYAYKNDGTLPDDSDLADKVKKIAASISKADAKDFAETKHKGKPEVVESMSFTEFLLTEGVTTFPKKKLPSVEEIIATPVGKDSNADAELMMRIEDMIETPGMPRNVKSKLLRKYDEILGVKHKEFTKKK